MCGICGVYGLSDKRLAKRMADSLRHRGPDGEGFYVDDGVSLGHRRLSIIDLRTGDQPIFNEATPLLLHKNEDEDGSVYI
jgi:asparagine synthase (glutamine-hydrolysing)